MIYLINININKSTFKNKGYMVKLWCQEVIRHYENSWDR